jgi:hypothetical protein
MSMMTRIGESTARFFAQLRDRFPALGCGKLWLRVLIVVVVLLALYYPAGMLYLHKIDDAPNFTATERDRVVGGSAAVAIAAALIDREVNQYHWVANDPFFLPGAALDNMPNYQMGVVAALARFAFELTDQLGRARGSSQTDRDLQEAAGLLQYSGTKWIFDFSTSIAPTATSEAQYNRARSVLLHYNNRLAQGQAVFERRADNLLSVIDRIALDLGASSAVIDSHIAAHSGQLIDAQADDLFYSIKGQLYAYYLVLRELGVDYDRVIKEKELSATWAQMIASLRTAATLHPLVIVNGRPDGQLAPSHLAVQGFYLLRARTQMREITNILLK